MKKISILYGLLFLCLSGCNYLDIVPEKDIETIETIFEKRENALDWLKSCYVMLADDIGHIGICPAYLGADEIVTGDYTREHKIYLGGIAYQDWNALKISDGLQMSQEPFANIWKKNGYYASIRYCNIFLDKIDHVYNMKQEEKNLWSAEVKALKGHLYFELMRRYGPIVLVPENIEAEADLEAMRLPRSPLDTCVKAIVDLMDDAMKTLPSKNSKDVDRLCYHNRESAATIKAYALLYAASPIFNGNASYSNIKNKDGVQLFSQQYDANKWKIAGEAIDEAIELCNQSGIKLYDQAPTKKTKLLTDMANIENSALAQNMVNIEAIYMVRLNISGGDWFNFILPRVPSKISNQYNDYVDGTIGASLNMVEMFYTNNGLPIDKDITWPYFSRYLPSKETNTNYTNVVSFSQKVLGLHLHREPRFYADIAADRCYWQRGKQTSENMLVEPYKDETMGTTISTISNSVQQNLSGYWIKKHLHSDLNGSEYRAFSYSADEPTIIFRLAELYLMQAEAWNEFSGPSDKVYEALNKVRRRAGIPDVQTSWATYSNEPTKFKNKEGLREIIHDEWNVEFAFEGRRFYNLRRWLQAEVLNQSLLGWNILGTNAEQFYNNYKGPVVVWSKHKFTSPRDYLFPIKAEEAMISGCTQNLGW